MNKSGAHRCPGWFQSSHGLAQDKSITRFHLGLGASWQYHRNAAFRRQILGILSVLPRKRGVPSRVSSFRGGTAKMRPLGFATRLMGGVGMGCGYEYAVSNAWSFFMNPKVVPASCRQTNRKKALPARFRQHLGVVASSIGGS